MKIAVQNPDSRMTFYCEKMEFGMKQKYILYVFYIKHEYIILQFMSDSGVTVEVSDIEDDDVVIRHEESDPESEDFFDSFPQRNALWS